MDTQVGGWIDILSTGDAEALWVKLFRLVSKHSSIKALLASDKVPRSRIMDLHADLTQDLFIKLYQKGRFQLYLNCRYTDENIEHELYHIEVPNLISFLLRERYPESYRIARRVSCLLQTRPEFEPYPRRDGAPNGSQPHGPQRASRKLVLKAYGLSTWPLDKPMKNLQHMTELIKEVAHRKRDTRRTGRGSGSQVIISNDELTRLIVDIFEAIDSPADVRSMRSLVLSKLAVEDSRFVSIDAGPMQGSETETIPVDIADSRPTPEQILLEKENVRQVNVMAEELLEMMREAVDHKLRRYSKLVRIVWHCYFDPSAPAQTKIARMMGISDSLVSHYRKIFDRIIRDIQISADQWRLLNYALGAQLEAIVTTAEAPDYDQPIIAPSGEDAVRVMAVVG